MVFARVKRCGKLKIGILDADILAENLIGQYGSYAQMIQALIEPLDASIETQIYRVIEGEYPNDISACDAYIITGSKSSAYDGDEWILRLGDYVRLLFEHDITLLGICFGHQLIAHALGGEVQRSHKGWGVGVHCYQSEKAGRRLFLPAEFALLASHQDQVVSLPSGAQRVAFSAFCPNAAYQIEHKVLCFQPHPEFVPEYADALMQNRKDIIPSAVFAAAQRSLTTPTDHLQVARIMLSFLKGGG
jgi:GMP synthase-like glutamine amidotransferase